MQTLALAGGGIVLVLTVGLGVLAHELSHAAVLFLFGVGCDIDIGPNEAGRDRFGAGIFGTWAAVTPNEISPDTSARVMRLSSIAPLFLAAPFVAVALGIVPDPLQADNLLLTALTVGWLACAIPSPQDFSVFWHPERAVTVHTAATTDR